MIGLLVLVLTPSLKPNLTIPWNWEMGRMITLLLKLQTLKQQGPVQFSSNQIQHTFLDVSSPGLPKLSLELQSQLETGSGVFN